METSKTQNRPRQLRPKVPINRFPKYYCTGEPKPEYGPEYFKTQDSMHFAARNAGPSGSISQPGINTRRPFLSHHTEHLEEKDADHN